MNLENYLNKEYIIEVYREDYKSFIRQLLDYSEKINWRSLSSLDCHNPFDFCKNVDSLYFNIEDVKQLNYWEIENNIPKRFEIIKYENLIFKPTVIKFRFEFYESL
jgi:hypothetical protein